MKISEMLKAMASWLENPDNEALLLAEYDSNCLEVVASSCITAANELRKAAAKVDEIEPAVESKITSENLNTLANIAEAFDRSDNPGLQKQAHVIDEILLTIAASPDAFSTRQGVIDAQINDAREKFIVNQKKTNSAEEKKIADAKEAIEESGATKNYRVLEHSLSSRGCPDHAGTPLSRVAENSWQCALDGKVYDYQSGFTLENGDVVPGSSVMNQNALDYYPEFSMFDTREGRMKRDA